MSYVPKKEHIEAWKQSIRDIDFGMHYCWSESEQGLLLSFKKIFEQRLAACEALSEPTPHPSTWPEETTATISMGHKITVMCPAYYGNHNRIWALRNDTNREVCELNQDELSACTDITFPDGRVFQPSKKQE